MKKIVLPLGIITLTVAGCVILPTYFHMPKGASSFENKTCTLSYKEMITDAINVSKTVHYRKVKNVEFYKVSMDTCSLPSSLLSAEFSQCVIGEADFSKCSSMTDYEFEACEIDSVVLPSGMDSIPDSAFIRCTGLEDVSIPDSVTKIGSGSFYQSSLTKIDLPDELQVIDDWAFTYTPLISITCPDSLKSIGDYAFHYSAVSEVSFGSSLEVIGAYAFANCNSLKEITLPSSVRTIEDGAFGGAASLSSIHLSKGIESIGAHAIAGESLSDVYFDGTEEEWNAISKGECAVHNSTGKAVTVHASDAEILVL